MSGCVSVYVCERESLLVCVSVYVCVREVCWWPSLLLPSVCVCVCVRERERETVIEREREREWVCVFSHSPFLIHYDHIFTIVRIPSNHFFFYFLLNFMTSRLHGIFFLI